MPLPDTISKVFELARQDGKGDESSFYGPYNVLLNYLFPFEEEYVVVPQYKRHAELKSVHFMTIFLVKHKHHPVFFVEVKYSATLCYISGRKEADLEMRERFGRLFEDVEIETLYGASAMGTKLCLYTLDMASRRLEPNAIPRNPEFGNDTAPADRWNVDIMTPEGEERLREVVRDIKEMLGQL
ncbi:hypothetical protein L873DRAFT_1262723 [Choiromyces venosus 120613-1]|uniref:Uncharacterized protein n=1 Tax=Choiromyces venosus 120613-1 TaxID=1336337 RepID=A0A3N4JI57_9PEZI|nr:hypothetical protein L873DRAFT_1262723 [Choiromyces venosus 120613-1]